MPAAKRTKNASTTSAKNNADAKALNTARAANATCRRADAIQVTTAKSPTNASVIPALTTATALTARQKIRNIRLAHLTTTEGAIIVHAPAVLAEQDINVPKTDAPASRLTAVQNMRIAMEDKNV